MVIKIIQEEVLYKIIIEFLSGSQDRSNDRCLYGI